MNRAIVKHIIAKTILEKAVVWYGKDRTAAIMPSYDELVKSADAVLPEKLDADELLGSHADWKEIVREYRDRGATA